MKTLTTRGRVTAEAIRDLIPFKTRGGLSADNSHYGTGRLCKAESDIYWANVKRIDYAVYSYATPIAWHYTDGTWYRVSQKFSVTTSHHQGVLYLIKDAD